MLNTTVHSNPNLKINAVSGMLVKNHPKSFFIRFGNNSQRAQELFGPYAHYDRTRVVILQLLVLPENYFLAEIVFEKDYEQIVGGND